jgi:hypothetical protein
MMSNAVKALMQRRGTLSRMTGPVVMMFLLVLGWAGFLIYCRVVILGRAVGAVVSPK